MTHEVFIRGVSALRAYFGGTPLRAIYVGSVRVWPAESDVIPFVLGMSALPQPLAPQGTAGGAQ